MAKNKVLEPVRLKEMQLFLDDCVNTHEPVSIVALSRTGEKMVMNGWIVTSGHWRGGTHNFRNPVSKQMRKVRDILIFSINGHTVYV